jgi:DNA-binding NarL/FixJ family response regulator
VTTKSATLPCFREPERLAAPAARPKLAFARDDAAGAPKRPAVRPRILIVEDDFLVAADVEAALLDAGFEVIGIAETAGSALALVAAEKPSLVLMDIRLAGARDGIDTAIEIYRKHGIRSLFASAHSDELARARAQAAQPLGWLQKPYSMGRLVDAVAQALSDLADDEPRRR